MWLVRLRMRKARPWARGRIRLSVGPSSTYALDTMRLSGSRARLFSALAIALARTLATGALAACGANRRTASASCAVRPLISSTTLRALVGVTRTNRARATARGSSSASASLRAFMVYLPDSLSTSTFLSRWSSTKGPFFKLRGIFHTSALLAGAAAADDQLVTGLVAPGAALGPAGRVNRVTAAGGLALTAAVRVVDRVHGDAAHDRTLALPAHPPGLAPVDVAVLGVADLTDGGPAAHIHVA